MVAGRKQRAAKLVKKSYMTSETTASEMEGVCELMGVTESAIVNFALRYWLANYYKVKHEVLEHSVTA